MTEQNELTAEMPWIDRADANVDAFIFNYSKPVSFDLSEKLRFWSKNGYVVFRNVVPLDLIDQFIAEVDHLRENFHDYAIPIEVRGKQTWSKAVSREVIEGIGVKFNHLHTYSLHAAHLSLTREVTEFLQAVFGSPAAPMQSLTFWMGSQQSTHIDYPFVNMQRRLAYMAASWIPLEDVHADAGPLAYYPGAHRPEVTGFFDWGGGDIISREKTRLRNGREFAAYLDDRLLQAHVEREIFLPKKGDVLIWHCNMPHTGTTVRDDRRTRKSYVTHFTGLDDYPARWIPQDGKGSTGVIRRHSGVIMDFPWNKAEGKLPSWRDHFAGKTEGGGDSGSAS
jgi:phytanoyl-CoA hydroxylase